MTALAASREPPEIKGKRYQIPVAADKLIYRGALVVLDSNGRATPATTATNLRAFGVAEDFADNRDGAAGAISVPIKVGIFGFANSGGGDAITVAEIGQTAYIVDDQTVAKTNGGGTRSPAGAIRWVENGQVFVDVGMPSSIDGDLVASNNLGEVASAAAARANIGANKYSLNLRASDLVGADTKVYRVVCPVAGTLKKVHTVIDAALATGDATLTSKINAATVTNGAVTITQAGSAAGDKDSATPSGANTITAGDTLSVTIGGTNTANNVTAEVTFEIET